MAWPPPDGEKSQILAALGRFREALRFDEKAMADVQRLAEAGDRLSQEEVWVYRVNRGRLYLLMGQVVEAEQLLREALPHIHPRRRMYCMFAQDALDEIERWRQTKAPHYQLDWRWIETYRRLASLRFLRLAGPCRSILAEEQRTWDRLSDSPGNAAAQDKREALLARSRERELASAMAEQREPRLCYPAICSTRCVLISLASWNWTKLSRGKNQTRWCDASTRKVLTNSSTSCA